LKLKRSLAISGISAALTIGMVAGIPLSASAATTQYWGGILFQNEVQSSPTTFMNGGHTYIQPAASLITVWGTVLNVGSFYAPADVQYTFAGRSTWQYCKWTAPGNHGDKIATYCKYWS
jgi:hypothetical protein